MPWPVPGPAGEFYRDETLRGFGCLSTCWVRMAKREAPAQSAEISDVNAMGKAHTWMVGMVIALTVAVFVRMIVSV